MKALAKPSDALVRKALKDAETIGANVFGYKLQLIPVDKIRSREGSKTPPESLVRKFERGDSVVPIIVANTGRSYTIIEGHHRWEAAKQAWRSQMWAVVIETTAWWSEERVSILNSLAEAIEPDHVKAAVNKRLDEITAMGAAKAAFAVTAMTWALSQFKLPKPSQYSQRASALTFAKQLVLAKDDKEIVGAVVGLLNICARALLQVPNLRELGYRLTKIVNDSKFEDFAS